MNAKKLVDLWLSYARENGIAAGKQEGRPAEDTDLIAFLTSHGFEESQIKTIIDALPDATPSVAEPKINRSIRTGTRLTASDGNLYVWAGQRWLNDKTLQPATKEISDELNDKESEKQSQAAKEPEPTGQEAGTKGSDNDSKDDGRPGVSDVFRDTGIDRGSEETVGSEKETPVKKTSADGKEKEPDVEAPEAQEITPKQAEYLNRIKKVIKAMNKDQIRQLKRELK